MKFNKWYILGGLATAVGWLISAVGQYCDGRALDQDIEEKIDERVNQLLKNRESK